MTGGPLPALPASSGLNRTRPPGVVFTLPSGAVTLAAGASQAVAVGMSAARGTSAGHKQAVLQVSAGGQTVANAMLFVLVK